MIAASSPPLVAVEDLKIQFRSRTGLWAGTGPVVSAVDGVTLGIAPGESFGLVGESGCGKSTLGRAVLGLHEPSAGRVLFDGTDLMSLSAGDLRRLRRRMQMIFQDPSASLDPKMRVAEILLEPIITHSMAAGRAADDLVDETLRLVGLDPGRRYQYPHEFSGGQRQRIGIARALTVRPDFLVCDEATSALDVSIRAQVLNLLSQLRRAYGLGFLFISHDLGVVRHMSDRIGVMYLGRLVEVGLVHMVFTAPAHPYTHALLSAVPIPDPEVEHRRRRIILDGDLPNPASPPSGCRFHTRCWLHQRLGRPNRCRDEEPVLTGSSGHSAACHFQDESGDAGAAETINVVGRSVLRRRVRVREAISPEEECHLTRQGF
jgi:oligopeptide/dipeptide ABC transporter ATP-binding protein